MNYEIFVDRVIQREADFVDHPDDRGGPTRWGITQTVARQNGYDGPMQELPQRMAREIYRKRYIVRPAFDRVALLSVPIASELIDTGINMGPSRAAEFLQRWLNGFNLQGSRYADLFVDGAIGEVTLAALRKYLRWRGAEGEAVMVMALNCAQGVRYLELAEASPSQESFLYGWMRARVLAPA